MKRAVLLLVATAAAGCHRDEPYTVSVDKAYGEGSPGNEGGMMPGTAAAP